MEAEPCPGQMRRFCNRLCQTVELNLNGAVQQFLKLKRDKLALSKNASFVKDQQGSNSKAHFKLQK